MTAAPIDKVLPALKKVRQGHSGQYMACCPAHEDRSPSLSVRETPDGAVLLHCFGGCSISAVLDALGLEMSDLFPPREVSGREPKRMPCLLTPGQALNLLDQEANLVVVVAANLLHGVKLSQTDLARIRLAAQRIHWLLEESSPMKGANA